MNLPSDAPKMNYWIFWVGDLLLLATAWFVHTGADHPTAGVALIITVACVVAAVFVAVVPSVVEYARRQDEALDERQRALQALAVTVAAAAEQVSIAATGLQGIAEAAQENFGKTEHLSQQINDRIAELDARFERASRDEAAALTRLEAVAKKIVKAAGEFDGAVARSVPLPEVAPVIASRIAEIRPAVVSSHNPFPETAAEVAPVVAPPPEAPAAAEPAPESVPPKAESPVLPEIAVPPPESPAAPRKRGPRKPTPAVEIAAEETPSPAAVPDLVLESPAPEEVPLAAAPQEPAEPAVSADGATRLVITAYIGIGNRLFIRGDAPGLDWEKGIPLTFVSIGKWRWETSDATSTVRFKLYKNDQVESTLGQASVEPGAQLELSASF
jgi:hypothetical protein